MKKFDDQFLAETDKYLHNTYRINLSSVPSFHISLAYILDKCEGDQSRALQEIPQLNYAIKYVTTHLQEIPQGIR